MATNTHPKAPTCKPPREAPPGKKWIYRPSKQLPDGRRIWAWQYGKQAFALLVDDE